MITFEKLFEKTRLTDAAEIEMLGMLRTMKQVVAEEGSDYIYVPKPTQQYPMGACVYVYNGKPDCLAGRVLARMGVPLWVLESYEGSTINQMIVESSSRPINLTNETIHVLRQAQRAQDRGETWGYCLEQALHFANSHYGVTL